MTDVVLINQTTVLTDAQVAAVVPVLQVLFDRDFEPVWGTELAVAVSAAPSASAGQWPIYLQDTTNVPGAGGYHVDDGADPTGYVFARDAMEANESWTVDLTHEFLEMCGDPTTSVLVDLPQMAGYACLREACFSGESLVAMADGSTVAIVELVGRDNILVRALDDRGQIVAAPAVARLSGRLRQTVVVHFNDGSTVACTPDHRFLTGDGEWCPASRLTDKQVAADVSPRNPVKHGIDGAARHSVFSRQNDIALHAPRAESEYIALRQAMIADEFAVQISVAGHSSLAGGILRIVFGRSEEQMEWIYAGGLVASVAHLLSFRYRSAVQFIREAVGAVKALAEAQLTVSEVAACSGPQPTTIRLSNAAPKDIKQFRLTGIVSREPADVGVAVAPPPPPVGRAISTSADRSSASGDRTGLHTLLVDAVEVGVKADVYDIVVPKMGNFVLANGAIAHNCDAVEDDALGYDVGGTLVTDWCTPEYFYQTAADDGSGRGTYDFRGHIASPAPALLHGGYLGIRTPDGRWGQVSDFVEGAPSRRASRRAGRLGRAARRAGGTRL